MLKHKTILNNGYNITKSINQTKEWRKLQDWYKGGKKNECETYQKELINLITKDFTKFNKTNLRLNKETYQINYKKNIFTYEDGFEYTEDFDILQHNDNKIFLYNLKMVCNQGGSQNRTLSEVYEFIRLQLGHLIKFKPKDLYFINILDGDTSNKKKLQFNYLINKEKYNKYKNKIFIGDMYEFSKWYFINKNSNFN